VRMSIEIDHAAYDCVYLALAIDNKCQFVGTILAATGGVVDMARGPRGEKRPADVNARAVMIAKIATGEIEDERTPKCEFAREGGLKSKTPDSGPAVPPSGPARPPACKWRASPCAAYRLLGNIRRRGKHCRSNSACRGDSQGGILLDFFDRISVLPEGAPGMQAQKNRIAL
jgi:hypothetical protein